MMTAEPNKMMRRSMAEYNAQVFVSKGINIWRKIYLQIAKGLKPSSVIELGAGDPCLLGMFPQEIRRTAVDGTTTHRDSFLEAGISFVEADLNNEKIHIDGRYDLAICSDVFEHLITPEIALKNIALSLDENGVLFAHVPNEFRLRKTLRIMAGMDEAKYSHSYCEEWNHPHLHRFTDIGFRKFLGLEFSHLVSLTRFGDRKFVRILRATGLPIPYCLEGGPTYACTNSKSTALKIETICSRLKRGDE